MKELHAPPGGEEQPPEIQRVVTATVKQIQDLVAAAQMDHGGTLWFPDFVHDILDEATCLAYLCLDLVQRPATASDAISVPADLTALAQLGQFASRMQKRLQSLSLQLDETAGMVSGLRQECSTLIHNSSAARAKAVPFFGRLTPREVNVLQLAASGHHNVQIATALGIAPETVKSYWRNIFQKLRVHTRAAALARFLGLVLPQQGGFLPRGALFAPNGG